MKKLVLVLLPVTAGGLLIWLLTRPAPPPEVPFARLARQRVLSAVVTNARVEPMEAALVRSPRAGALERLHVDRSQTVGLGQAIAEIEASGLRAELAAAEARRAAADAELAEIERGGPKPALADIAVERSKMEFDLAQARRELEATERLVARQAEPAVRATEARDRVRRLEIELEGLDRKRPALVAPGARAAAEARRREAQAAIDTVQRQLERATVRAPMAGVVYHVAVRPGAYLQPGDLIAEIGQLAQLRAIVYVDEPELGKVAVGMPVEFTWDAEPGRTWPGRVEQMPAQVVSFNTRQVGEVRCRVENSDGRLKPGANLNAEIRSRVVERALALPKAALRREAGLAGVFVLEGDKLAWRRVEIGVASLTHVEVLSGLAENEAVALAAEVPLAAGMRVNPRFR